MIFDEHTYSSTWVNDFPIVSANQSGTSEGIPLLRTHSTIGGLTTQNDLWRFEPGLGGDLEIAETLLLHCGYRLTFANNQVFELIHLQPGVLLGRLPRRAKPELFATQLQTEEEGSFAFLTEGSLTFGLWSEVVGQERHFVLLLQAGDRKECQQQLEEHRANLFQKLQKEWDVQYSLRKAWCDRLPESIHSESSGLAFERLQGLVERGAGIFKGAWIRDDNLETKGMSLDLTAQLIPAFAIFRPEVASELLKTLSDLPLSEKGAWAAAYTLQGHMGSENPALPYFSTMLISLPKEVIVQAELPRLLDVYAQHLSFFLDSRPDMGLPQWPQAENALTPEVTDPSALQQFDLSALLIAEIESMQKLRIESSFMEAERKELDLLIWKKFWSAKRSRLLDKTVQGEFASRVTAGALLPLLWKNASKNKLSALRQCLLNPEELRSPQGIRQWEPKKEDPISPPIEARTQLVLLPLLDKLPIEGASLLSADWHRMLEADPEFTKPEAASMWIRLLPYAQRINPHLERYPAWVRSMEKHRKIIVTIAATILLLIPTGFGMYVTLRSKYSPPEEFMQSGHAETLITMGKVTEAEEVYTQLINRSRADTRLNLYYLNRGNLRFKQERYPEALEDYERAIAYDPVGNLFKARWNLGQVHARLEQYEEAIEVLQAFIFEYGEELPSFKVRAENAITLWQK